MSSPVIDAHQHFWDPARADYPWMADAALAPIRRAFGPDDLAPLLTANSVDAVTDTGTPLARTFSQTITFRNS